MSGLVIVGTGHAAVALLAALREANYRDRITLLGEERHLPYERPPLSKAHLSLPVGAECTSLRPASFYEAADVELALDDPVTAIDRIGHQVTTRSGRRVAYTELVLATGARPRRLRVDGIGLDGVQVLRTLDDAEVLRDRLPRTKRAVVVGGGFIGLEVAAVAVKHRVAVTIVEAADRLMARAVSVTTAAHFETWHRAAGTQVRLRDTVVTIIERNGTVGAVRTAAGVEIPADLVVVGAGVVPNSELAAEAGLLVDHGVVVDEFLQTADPAISAIGDCASFRNVRAGSRTRIESIQNATDQAKLVAERLLGVPQPYSFVPWFWTIQGDQKLQIAGLRKDGMRDVVRRGRGRGFSVFSFGGGRLAAVESVNDPGTHMLSRRVLGASSPLTEADFDASGFDFALAARAGHPVEEPS